MNLRQASPGSPSEPSYESQNAKKTRVDNTKTTERYLKLPHFRILVLHERSKPA